MRRAAFLALALALALVPSARAAGYDFTSGRSFAQAAAEGGANVFSIPFHVNTDGFVYLKLLDTDRNAVNNGATANGSASAKTGWWIEWALQQGGATQELGARNDDKPTDLVPVKAGEDDAIVLRVHWPAEANAAGAADIVYGALAFRLDAAAAGPGGASGASQDEARSFHVEIDMTGAGGPVPSPSPTPSPSPSVGGSTGSPSQPSPQPSPSPSASSPTPDVSGINVGSGTKSGSATNASNVVVIEQQAPLPAWVMPLLLAQSALVLVACLVALLAARRGRRIELVVRNDDGVLRVETAQLAPDEARSIRVREK